MFGSGPLFLFYISGTHRATCSCTRWGKVLPQHFAILYYRKDIAAGVCAPCGCFVPIFLIRFFVHFRFAHYFSVTLSGFIMSSSFPPPVKMTLKLFDSHSLYMHLSWCLNIFCIQSSSYKAFWFSLSDWIQQVGRESSCWVALIKVNSVVFSCAGSTSHIITQQESSINTFVYYFVLGDAYIV